MVSKANTTAVASSAIVGTAEGGTSSIFYVLVIAHPDDESMFFLPMIRSLIDSGYIVWLLCLTTGDYDGLGKIRIKEITEVGKMIGISKVIVRNDEELQDHPTKRWNHRDVSNAIRNSLKPFKDNSFVLITFDALGISGHVNHIDTYCGVQHLKSNVENTTAITTTINKREIQVLEVWYLESEENFLFKYVPILSWILLFISLFNDKVESTCTVSISNDNRKEIRVYRMHNPLLNWKAMAIHHSQFVWYRRLFVVFSSYTYYNKLTKYSNSSCQTNIINQ